MIIAVDFRFPVLFLGSPTPYLDLIPLQLQNQAKHPIEVIWIDHYSVPAVAQPMMVLKVKETVRLFSYEGHQFQFKYLSGQDPSPPSLSYTKLDLSESLTFFIHPTDGFSLRQEKVEEDEDDNERREKASFSALSSTRESPLLLLSVSVSLSPHRVPPKVRVLSLSIDSKIILSQRTHSLL
jgi:hypothetical protein